MPYKSDAQRRFFHSEGARKVGITPAMVAEWDEASRGHKVPEKVEKKADLVAWRLGKLAAMSMAATSKMQGLGKPTAPTSTSNATTKPDQLPGSLNPRSSLDQFRSTASDNAQRASSDKLQVGESLTMPT